MRGRTLQQCQPCIHSWPSSTHHPCPGSPLPLHVLAQNSDISGYSCIIEHYSVCYICYVLYFALVTVELLRAGRVPDLEYVERVVYRPLLQHAPGRYTTQVWLVRIPLYMI